MYQNDSSYRCLISIKYCIITERGENMLDLQKHKEYLWKYLLTYGKARKKRDVYKRQYLYHINGSVQISHFIPKIRYCTMRRLCMRSADCSIGPCIPAVFPVWRNLCSLRRIQLYSRLAKAFLFLNCVSEPKYINSSGSGYAVGNW